MKMSFLYQLFMKYHWGIIKLKRPEMKNKDENLPLNTLIQVFSNEFCHGIFSG
jgi:hypothetical protein